MRDACLYWQQQLPPCATRERRLQLHNWSRRFEPERPHPPPHQRRQMRPAPQLPPHVVRQTADVRPLPALHLHIDQRRLETQHLNPVDLHGPLRQRHGLSSPSQAVGALASDLHGAERRG